MIDTSLSLPECNQDIGKESNKLLVDYFFKMINEIQPTHSIEIGAFSAQFSRDLKEINKTIISYAFEANPYNYNYFNEKYSFKDINYFNIAISNVNKNIIFNMQKSIHGKNIPPVVGNNSLLKRSNPDVIYTEIEIESITLNAFFKKNNLEGKNVVLWVDVEGATREVLSESEELLKYVSLIFIEVEEIMFWKEQWLEKDVDIFLKKQNFVPLARDREYNKQYNKIYVKDNYYEKCRSLLSMKEL